MESDEEKKRGHQGVDPEKLKKEKERLRRFAQGYAQRKDLALNPDEEVVETVLTGLGRNRLIYGKPFCPCLMVTGNPEEDKKIICPCAFHMDTIEKIGRCHCGIFVKKDFAC